MRDCLISDSGPRQTLQYACRTCLPAMQAWESMPFDQVCTIGVIGLWFMYPSVVQYLFGLVRCRQLDAVSVLSQPRL